MKVLILAGGYGTQFSEHGSVVPKPLAEIGGRPILWHIMRLYSYHGLNDFVICCGSNGSLHQGLLSKLQALSAPFYA
jgi:glucose-1-phosphate cytidylyltransferase